MSGGYFALEHERGRWPWSGGARRLPRRAVALLGALLLSLAPLVAAPGAQATGGTPETVVAWGCGGGNAGQCNVPAGLSGVTAIAAGDQLSLALKSDGTVVAWGKDTAGQTNVPAGLSGVTAIGAGFAFSLALKGDGTVVAWGCGSSGGLSYDYGQCSVPALPSGVTYTAIAAGWYHGLALKSDGTVVAWGCGSNSVGSADWGQCSVPAGLSGVVAIAAGEFQSLALKGDGTVVAWGCSGFDYGQCSVPAGLSGVTAIAAGQYHSLALKGDGTVVAWGCATTGGSTTDDGQCNVPAGLSGVTAIAAGGFHSLALKGDGTVVAWGCGTDRFGNNFNFGQCNVPAGLSGVTAIAAGGFHSLALAPQVAATTTTTVGSSTNPAVVGQQVTYTATVSPAPDGGTVSFADGGTPIAGCSAQAVTTSTGTATCQLTYSVAGSHSITTTYSGDSAFVGSTSAALAETVAPATPELTWANPADITYGTALSPTQLNATASVPGSFTYTPPAGTALAAGSGQTLTVAFTPTDTTDYTPASTSVVINVTKAPLTITASSPTVTYSGAVPAITPIYSGFVNGDTAAALTTPPTCTSTAPSSGAAGTYTTSCAGAADPNYSITNVTGTLTINPAPQTITFGPLSNTTYGTSSVPVSATASSGLPVSFNAGPAAVCTVAGTTVTIAGAGNCTVTASQPGNGNYQAAPSVAESFSVARAASSTGLTSSANPIKKGHAVIFTATVTSVAGPPTSGTVTFKDGTTVLGTGALNASGAATLTTASLSKGTHSITVVYGGTSNYNGSTSAVLTQTVK
jgi:hypothetical protein